MLRSTVALGWERPALEQSLACCRAELSASGVSGPCCPTVSLSLSVSMNVSMNEHENWEYEHKYMSVSMR